MADDRDYTNKYNTPLSSSEQGGFEAWSKAQSESVGRDVTRDLYDYDLKGWWKNNPGVDLAGGHLTDRFKKPNHPTFSDQSQYHGSDELQGGQWGQSQDGSYSFKPGATNLKNYSPDELKSYFQRVEPGNRLILPPP